MISPSQELLTKKIMAIFSQIQEQGFKLDSAGFEMWTTYDSKSKLISVRVAADFHNTMNLSTNSLISELVSTESRNAIARLRYVLSQIKVLIATHNFKEAA